MKNFSTIYIFIFSSIMVVIVAFLLSIAAMQLKPFQDKNIETEKMQNIIASINIASTPKNAKVLYKKYITESFTINYKGEKTESTPAFSVALKDELIKPVEKRSLPVFVSTLPDSEKLYIIPLRGKGLWGPIWGYISLKKDFNTIYGAFFDHQGETPGLGAEIKENWFQQTFINKQILNSEGTFTSIKIVKGGTEQDNPNQVDGISGGTITSKGLEKMIESGLADYKAFFEKNRQ